MCGTTETGQEAGKPAPLLHSEDYRQYIGLCVALLRTYLAEQDRVTSYAVAGLGNTQQLRDQLLDSCTDERQADERDCVTSMAYICIYAHNSGRLHTIAGQLRTIHVHHDLLRLGHVSHAAWHALRIASKCNTPLEIFIQSALDGDFPALGPMQAPAESS